MVELSVPRLVQRLVAAGAAPAEAAQHELFLALGEALAKRGSLGGKAARCLALR